MQPSEITSTLLAFVLPVMSLLIAWYRGSVMSFGILATVFGILGSIDADEVIGFFQYDVVGGSTYYPATFLALALCVKKFGLGQSFATLIYVVMGLFVFSVAQFKGALLHDSAAAIMDGRNALLMTGMVYVGGLWILAIRRRMADGNVYLRCAVPVVVDIVMMTPFSLWIAYSAHPAVSNTFDWYVVAFWTYVVRMAVPVMVLTPVFFLEKDIRTFDLKE